MAASKAQNARARQKCNTRKKRRRRQRKKKRELKLIESGTFDDLRLYLIAKRMYKEAQKSKLKPMPEKLVFPYVKTLAEEKKKKQAAEEIAARLAGLSLS